MISTAVIFSTGCMSESIMNVNQVSAVVKTVYFASFFIVCKLRAVVSISQRQTVALLCSGIFCNTLYTIRFCSIITVFYRISVNIMNFCQHMISIVDVFYFFAVNICNACKIAAAVSKCLFISGRTCNLCQCSTFSIIV